MMKKLLPLLILLFFVVMLFACGGQEIRTISAEESTMGADFSPADLQTITDHMASSISSARFIQSERYVRERPRWVLAERLNNDTDEHIETRVIMERIRTRLINDGIAIFIDDSARDNALAELQLQSSDLYNSDTAAQVGNFVGAQFIMSGRISNMRQRVDREEMNFFNITLQVVDIETIQIVWTDEVQIGRIVERSRFR